jgi:hypothetical protein
MPEQLNPPPGTDLCNPEPAPDIELALFALMLWFTVSDSFTISVNSDGTSTVSGLPIGGDLDCAMNALLPLTQTQTIDEMKALFQQYLARIQKKASLKAQPVKLSGQVGNANINFGVALLVVRELFTSIVRDSPYQGGDACGLDHVLSIMLNA